MKLIPALGDVIVNYVKQCQWQTMWDEICYLVANHFALDPCFTSLRLDLPEPDLFISAQAATNYVNNFPQTKKY